MNRKFRRWIETHMLLMALLSVNTNMFGQVAQTGNSNGILPNILPASPEAASLGKFGEWPVSEYTGVPNISIPIYSIKLKGIEIPIQLSYHAGGIKVDEMASWVGAGWTLNAGGAITRTIVGLADDDPGGLIQRNAQGYKLKSSYSLLDSAAYVFLRQIANQTIDAEPDIYYYNFTGNSGKFCFDSLGNFHAIPVNNIKILQSAFLGLAGNVSANTTWTIADDKGNIYYFGSNDSTSGGTNGVEMTNSGTFPVRVENARVTSWYVTKIITADKSDTVYFDYGAKSEYYYTPPGISLRSLTNESGLSAFTGSGLINSWSAYFNSNRILYNGNPQIGTVLSASQSKGASTLTKIRWRGGEVDLVANTPRQDMPFTGSISNMLDSVNIYNQTGSRVKSFHLAYSYVQNRYFLDSLQQTAQSTPSLTHSFGYISRDQLPISASLNGVGSYAQDHWGYYNGATGNSSLLPSNALMPGIAASYLTANREPDTVKMQYGTLNKIIYPTGGYTTFNYTSNKYDPASPASPYSPASVVVNTNTTVQGPITSPYYQTITITPPFTQSNVSITVNVHDYADPPQKNMAWLPYLIFGNQSSGGFQQQYYGDAFDNFPTSGVTQKANGLYDFSFTVSNLTMTTGFTYLLTISDTCLKTINCADYPYAMPYISATINYLSYAPPAASGGTAPLPIAGGLRVTQLANYNMDNTLASKKLFTYQPGKLLKYPEYYRHYKQDVTKKMNAMQTTSGATGTVYCSPYWADMMEETSSSQVILGITQGSPVGYTQVTETEVDSNGNDKGYNAYAFSYSPDSLNTFYYDGAYWSSDNNWLSQSATINNFDYKRGLLQSKDTYKKNVDNSYIKIYAATTSYNFNDYNTNNHYCRVLGLRENRLRLTDPLDGQDSYVCGPTYQGYAFPNGVAFSPDFGYSSYSTITGWVQNTQSTEVSYDQNGLNPVTKIINTYYDNPLHLQPTRTVTTRSKQDTMITLVSYPQDYATGTPFIDSMIAHNVIAQPIERITYLANTSGNTTILNGTIMTFNPDGKGLLNTIKGTEFSTPIALSSFKFSNVGTGILPYNVGTKASFSPDSRYADKVTISAYDSYANTLTQNKVSDVNNSYIWDYNNTYPVAQAINAAQSDVAYTSFEADGTGNWTISARKLGTTGGLTGNNFDTLATGATISHSGLNAARTYLVTYWSKNGAATISGSTVTTGLVKKGWTFYQHAVPASSTSISITGAGIIMDELRLYPTDAQMTTYTYTPLVGMTSNCTASNLTTYYEYDGLNRLLRIRDMDGNILKQYDYQYQILNTLAP